MNWDTLLYLSVSGSVITVVLVSLVALSGIRYRRELPKLPIVRSIEALRLEQEELESGIAERHEALAHARESIRKGEEWEAWLQDKREEIESKKEELRDLDKDYRELELARDQREQLQESSRILTDKLTEQALALENIRNRCSELERSIPDLEAMQAEHKELNERIPLLKYQHQELVSKNEEISSSVEKAESNVLTLRQEQAKLTGTVEALQINEERLLASIEGLKSTLTEAGGSAEGQDPCEDLYRPYFTEVHEIGRYGDENDRLQRMVRTLEQVGIRLPTRTLYAFHTALKIQNISPFTILAGISGTGKSLLPAVYAKCMGLHFLNLPVQPSWNSPQDLFGFYNYMEHKYKATPLAQALLQFSPYDRPNAVSPVLDDQVLLVLLDEMNLARIEYYFSELLSRLELRRTIDPENYIDRLKVEIPLEIPWATEKGKKEVRIYPGENVLFSGTMNEDESTLSLSDKVLDRATILRFGKPTRLLTQQPDTSRLETADPLALVDWQRWCSLTDRAPSERSEKIINDDLARIMAELGAPLGHRGAQSIAQYLMLYPGQNEGSFNHALADQIEQKILPKVRGKEIGTIENPMRELVKLVQGLDDGQLARAINRGLEDNQGIFMWNGLDRSE